MPKNIPEAIVDALSDLSEQQFRRFCFQLLNRQEEPVVRRNRVEGRDYLDLTTVLVQTFTEAGALDVTVDLLKKISCNEVADTLVKETGRQSSKPESTPRPAADVSEKADEKHFVDKYKAALIQRVSNIGPILDELFDHDIIQQEVYEKIRALATTQEKMRELYCSSAFKGGRCCKDIFLKLLEKHERYLIADIKEK